MNVLKSIKLHTITYRIKSVKILNQKFNTLLIAIFLLSIICIIPVFSAQNAIPTFNCIGLYWSPGSGSSSNTCNVNYRVSGTASWKQGYPLWFDTKNSEYRGSLVNLKPNTNYEIQLSLQSSSTTTTLTTTTWSEDFPIAKTVQLPSSSSSTFTISESGQPNGYILYVASPSSTIDVGNNSDYCINVKGSYVIIRGATLKGAARDGINLSNNVHDVVVEQCDISGWGRIASDGFGIEQDAGVKAGSGTNVQRIIVQYNKLHNPRSNANNWTQPRPVYNNNPHPAGPQSIVFINPVGNNVLRYNEVYSDESHCFNDGIGGSSNNSTQGFPGANSDVYGNKVSNANDDALEMDGGGCNIRIWGNYMDITYVGISTTACSVGPAYVFRNVMGRSRQSPNNSVKGVFGKTGDQSAGAARQFWFHNTILQPDGPSGGGISSSGSGSVTMVVDYNNIWNGNYGIDVSNTSTTNTFDYDLYNGKLKGYSGLEPHGINASPIYAPNNGTINSKSTYQLDPKSPGYDAAKLLPNFNDDYTGNGPDIGAHEAGTPPMVFGISALNKEGNSTPVISAMKTIQSISKPSSKVITSIGNKSLTSHPAGLVTPGRSTFDMQGRRLQGPSDLKRKLNASGIQIEKIR